MNSEDLLTRRRSLLGNADQLSYKQPVHVVEATGLEIKDADGNTLLDFFNNVPHVGHCHPQVVDAVCQQVKSLNTNTRYLFDNIIEYSERITSLLPDGLDVCYFVSSGSEANDLGWRIANAVTGNSGGLVTERAYHGITDATYALSPYAISEKEKLAAHVMTVTPCDDYRGVWKRDDDNRGHHYAQYVATAIAELADKGHRPAAFYMDNILSSIGIHSPPPGYLKEAYRIVREAGALCIADEVQSGFGRVGHHLWGFQVDDAVPDMVTFGKPIANGIPMGLVVTTREIADRFREHADFFSTTGGNPVACAGALAVLDVIEEQSLVRHSHKMGKYFASGLSELANRHSLIGDVRGSGLFIGVELVRDHDTLEAATTETLAIVNQLRQNGVLVGAEGPRKNVIKIRPPLVIERSHVNRFIETLDLILQEYREPRRL